MNKLRTQRGQVIILNTLVFLSLATFIVYAALNPIISSSRATKAFVLSKQSFMLAHSATEEALYRLKNQMNLPSSEAVSLASSTATINVASTFDGKTVTVISDVSSYLRQIQIKISEATGVNFNYGLQAGKGGFEMAGGARINGNVYSNGDVIGSGGPIITGSATVANSSEPVAHQSNGGLLPAPYSIRFGGDTTPQDAAQSFKVSTSTPLSSIRFNIKKSKADWMNDITVRITNDSNGKPGKTTYASATLNASQITTSFNYVTIPFTSYPTLSSNTTYWVVLDTATTWGSYYSLSASGGTYENGIAKTGNWAGNNGGTWSNTSPSGLDMYFDLFVGGDTGLISGVTIGTVGNGNAWAHEVKNSTVYGTIYCQSSSNNNKACDTSRPDPTEQPFPISDGNIEDWKNQALAGGVTVGNLSYGSSDVVYLGPQKIEGNLKVGAGAILYITGTLWVTGDLEVSGGGVIKLDLGYGNASGVIVSDGRVRATGGGRFEGNGLSGNYILVLTTSTCPLGSCGGRPAVSVSGGTGAVILNAQKGTIEFSGGAKAKQATAEKIIMTGGTEVNYEIGLADMNFNSGPSGSWRVDEWSEL